MTAIGTSLAFWLRYPHEMSHFFEADNGDEFDVPSHIRDKLVRVGEAARGQLVSFLQECEPLCTASFSKVAKTSVRSNRSHMRANWTVEINIWPKGRRRPHLPPMTAGVAIEPATEPCVVPWMWIRGDSASEKAVRKIVRECGLVPLSDEFGWGSDTVGLARIPIFHNAKSRFDVDREPLLEQVRQTFDRLTESAVRKLLELL